MRKAIYILLGLFLVSCYEDIGNYDYKPLEGIEITGIPDDLGDFVLLEDTIRLNPIIEPVALAESGRYNYYWSKKVGVGTGAKWERISSEKNLVFPVEEGGSIFLMFEVEDKESGLITYQTMTAKASSRMGRGFYLLKDIDGMTDIDMISIDSMLHENLLEQVLGSSLEGAPVAFDFWGYRVEDYEAGKLVATPAIRIASNKDIAVLSTEDLKVLARFEDLFMGEAPASRNIEMLKSIAKITMLINDGQAYCYANYYNQKVGEETQEFGGNKFYSVLQNHETASGGYTLNPNVSWPFRDTNAEAFLVYDENSGMFRAVQSSSSALRPLGSSSAASLNQDMESELLFMKGTATGVYATDVYALMRKKADSDALQLITMNTMGFYQQNTLREMRRDELSAIDFQIDDASHWCVHQHAKVIYFSIGDQLFKYDVLSRKEELIMSFNGEEITHIDVVNERYLEDGASIIDVKHTKFIVATTTGTEYTLKKFAMNGSTLDPEPEFTSKGIGKIKKYMSIKSDTYPVWTRYYN